MTLKYLPYKSYPQADIVTHWNKLLEKSDVDIAILANEWDEIQLYNMEIYTKNRNIQIDAVTEIRQTLEKYGIETRNKTKGYTRQFTALIKPIDVWSVRSAPEYPHCHSRDETVNDIYLSNYCCPSNLLKLYNSISAQYKGGMAVKKRVEEVYQLCVKYIKDKQIPIYEVPLDSKKDVINFVRYYIFENHVSEEEKDSIDELDDYWLMEMLQK
jgi:hypothetical protein